MCFPERGEIWERQVEIEETKECKARWRWWWQCIQRCGGGLNVDREEAADEKFLGIHGMAWMLRGQSKEGDSWNKICCALWMCEAALCPISKALEGIIVMQWIQVPQSSPFICCWSAACPRRTVQCCARPVLRSVEFTYIWRTRALKTPSVRILGWAT